MSDTAKQWFREHKKADSGAPWCKNVVQNKVEGISKTKQARRFTTSDLLFCSGAPGRIRTVDTRFRRAVLYPLSYGGMLY